MTVAPQARTTKLVVSLAMGVGATLLIAALVNFAFGVQFPSNAPVESIYMFGITIDLVVAGLILFIRAIRNSRWPLVDDRPRRPTVLTIVAAVLSGIAFLAYLAFGGINFLIGVVDGERLRYMENVFGAFLAGGPWVLAFVFGVAGYRRSGGTANSVLSIGAIALALLVAVAVVASSIVYGLGLSD